jgi:Xaa-Pro aminopeptidase
MTGQTPSTFFTGNRQRVRADLTVDVPLIITANGLLQRGADSAYSFSQDANFWYLTGIDEPDIIAVIEDQDSYLIVPGRSGSRETFDGTIDVARLKAVSGIPTVLDETIGWERLANHLQHIEEVATFEPAARYIDGYGMYANPARRRLISRLRHNKPELVVQDVRPNLARLRMIKQPIELRHIQKAIDNTIDTLREVLAPDQLTQYANEYELEADLTRGYRRRGSTGHSFEPIVASGKRACTLHNVTNNGSLNPADLVVIDTGAEVQHYAADITRTVSMRQPSARQQAVYDSVLGVQAAAFELLKPGILMRDFESQVEALMGKALIRLKLIKKADHEAIRKYFPHATSHFLGLNVHDAGDYSLPLDRGMVVTNEPGIYIPEEGIGVRIEDDVVITKSGCQILSDRLPRRLI